MPDLAGELQGRVCPEDRPEPRLRAANRARRHPRLQPEGPGCPRGQVLAPQKDPRRLRPEERRTLEGDAPPLPEGVRIRAEPLYFGDGRRGRFPGGAYQQAGLGGDHPGYAFAPARGEMDASPRRWITSPDPLYERKKGGATEARPTDGRGCGRPRNLGGGFPGRVLVEPGGSAHLEQLLRGGQAVAPHPEVGRQGRPRAESHLLLRTLPARDRRADVVEIRRWVAGEQHNDPVP